MVIRECLCGCSKKFECSSWSKQQYFKNGHQHLNKKSKLKGKTYEEIYGKERANKKRKEQTLRQTGKKLNRIKPSYKKGLNYEKIYGIKKTIQIKEKIKNSNINNGLYWTKEKILQAYKNIPNIRKIEIRKYRKKGLMPDSNTIRKYFRTIDNMAIQANKLFLQPIYKISGIGQNEKLILDNIEKEKNIKLKRQYKVGRYYVDGYDIDNNVVYEVDEEYYHKYNQENDFFRENQIKEKLNCKIMRVNEQEFLLKINNHKIQTFIER